MSAAGPKSTSKRTQQPPSAGFVQLHGGERTGTELDLCVQAAKQLTEAGKKVRVVSMPCVELFDEQTDAYKEEVLPNAVRKRMVVEAAESFGWHRFIGLDGDSITMNRFGASAPGGTCLKEFGFTVENVVAKAKALLC